MSDTPIIFSAPMIRALLDGRKTMTRRLAWTEKQTNPHVVSRGWEMGPDCTLRRPSPWQRVKPGDRLWSRETAQLRSVGPSKGEIGLSFAADGGMGSVYWFVAEKHPFAATRWTPPIHMPRWASRLTLIVTATKIERLQKISNADAVAEGCGVNFDHPHPERTREVFPAERFRDLWIKLHGADSWDANPEVVAMSFSVHQTNIDAMPKDMAA